MNFLGCIHGLLYVKLRVTQIEMQKDLMAIMINSNCMIHIPHELRITSYPRSFQFYDFVLAHLRNNVSDELNEVFDSEMRFRY
jgi:hypothetical protein